MNRMKFSYLKLMAVAAVLAVALIPSLGTSTATSQPPLAALDVDISNEYRIIARYADDLVTYDKQAAELGKRARLVNSDFDPLQRKSDDLKGRLSEVQNAAGETVRKLKAANEWDDHLDTPPARITDPGLRALFQETSFKQLLVESSNGLTSHANEISTPVDNLRKRLTSQYGAGSDFRIIRATYEAPEPGKFVSLRCSINTLKVHIAIKLPSVNPSSQLAQETWAACHPGQPYPF